MGKYTKPSLQGEVYSNMSLDVLELKLHEVNFADQSLRGGGELVCKVHQVQFQPQCQQGGNQVPWCRACKTRGTCLTYELTLRRVGASFPMDYVLWVHRQCRRQVEYVATPTMIKLAWTNLGNILVDQYVLETYNFFVSTQICISNIYIHIYIFFKQIQLSL